MEKTESYVRARIDAELKARASEALDEMGLSVSDAIRLMMVRVAEDRRLPFPVAAPNKTTQEAIAELEEGRGRKVATSDALMQELNAED